MIEASSEVVVTASPQQVLELVLNLDEYRKIDKKIRKVFSNPPVDTDGHGVVEFRGAMRGIPGPRQREIVSLERWRSLEFVTDGPWLADLVGWSKGGFEVEEVKPGQTKVRHTYQFKFKGPAGWLMERYARNWLPRDLEVELGRLADYFSTS